jgi:hypothetical protein
MSADNKCMVGVTLALDERCSRCGASNNELCRQYDYTADERKLHQVFLNTERTYMAGFDEKNGTTREIPYE